MICAILRSFESYYNDKELEELYGWFDTLPTTSGKIVEDMIDALDGGHTLEVFPYGVGETKYDESLGCDKVSKYELQGFYMRLKEND